MTGYVKNIYKYKNVTMSVKLYDLIWDVKVSKIINFI